MGSNARSPVVFFPKTAFLRPIVHNFTRSHVHQFTIPTCRAPSKGYRAAGIVDFEEGAGRMHAPRPVAVVLPLVSIWLGPEASFASSTPKFGDDSRLIDLAGAWSIFLFSNPSNWL
jgi:hypothetical protein